MNARLFGFSCGIAKFDHLLLIEQLCLLVVLDFRRRLTATMFWKSHGDIGLIMLPCRLSLFPIAVPTTTASSLKSCGACNRLL